MRTPPLGITAENRTERAVRRSLLPPVVFPRPVRTVVVPPSVRRAVESHVDDDHPEEAGGFLACERRGSRLHAERCVRIPNEAPTPRWRFEATVDERAPPPPRVFYHSHTGPGSPSGLTRFDRRSIPEPFALVVFAPDGEALSFRAFKRGLLRWTELAVENTAGRERLIRLGGI